MSNDGARRYGAIGSWQIPASERSRGYVIHFVSAITDFGAAVRIIKQPPIYGENIAMALAEIDGVSKEFAESNDLLGDLVRAVLQAERTRACAGPSPETAAPQRGAAKRRCG